MQHTYFIAWPRIMKIGQIDVLFLCYYVENETPGNVQRWFQGYNVILQFISCFPVGYREISVKIFFDLTLVPPVKIPIFMFLLPRLIARASQPDGNMTSFTLHFSRLT